MTASKSEREAAARAAAKVLSGELSLDRFFDIVSATDDSTVKELVRLLAQDPPEEPVCGLEYKAWRSRCARVDQLIEALADGQGDGNARE